MMTNPRTMTAILTPLKHKTKLVNKPYYSRTWRYWTGKKKEMIAQIPTYTASHRLVSWQSLGIKRWNHMSSHRRSPWPRLPSMLKCLTRLRMSSKAVAESSNLSNPHPLKELKLGTKTRNDTKGWESNLLTLLKSRWEKMRRTRTKS